MRAWPRCSALPVADEAEQKRVPRSAAEEGAPTPTKMPGTANGGIGRPVVGIIKKSNDKFIKCGRGGIGRHVGFRFQWISVQVQVLSPVP